MKKILSLSLSFLILLISISGALVSLYLDIFKPLWYGIGLFMFAAFVFLGLTIFLRILYVLEYSENDKIIVLSLKVFKSFNIIVKFIFVIGIVQGILGIIMS